MVIGKKRKTDKTYRNKRVIVTDMGLKIFRYIGTKRESDMKVQLLSVQH